jgi:hypothetical protein
MNFVQSFVVSAELHRVGTRVGRAALRSLIGETPLGDPALAPLEAFGKASATLVDGKDGFRAPVPTALLRDRTAKPQYPLQLQLREGIGGAAKGCFACSPARVESLICTIDVSHDALPTKREEP